MDRTAKTFSPAPRAGRLAAHIAAWHTWDDAREALDAATGWDLSAADLHALTDLAFEARVGALITPARHGRFHALVHRGATVEEIRAVFGCRDDAPTPTPTHALAAE